MPRRRLRIVVSTFHCSLSKAARQTYWTSVTAYVNLVWWVRARQAIADGNVRGKSELHRARCWLTASEGDLKESATETYRPATSCMEERPRGTSRVRVKWRGKSSPAARRLAGRVNPIWSKTKQGSSMLQGSILAGCSPVNLGLVA